MQSTRWRGRARWPVSTEPVDIAVLQQERESAKRTISRGLVLICLVPIAIVLSIALGMMFDSFGPLIVASLYAVVGGSVGVAALGTGIVRHRIVSKDLRRLEAERIPQARLLS